MRDEPGANLSSIVQASHESSFNKQGQNNTPQFKIAAENTTAAA